ncbi:MAG: alpha/beta fold hydrolase [Elusimicrobiota bacterium]
MKKYFNLFILAAALTLALNACAKIEPGPDDKARFIASDGMIIAGKYVPPKTPDKITFILLHGLASTKDEWNRFEAKLIERGCGYFAYDLRGHHGSSKNTDGREITINEIVNSGQISEIEKLVSDIDGAVKYLKHNGIKKEKIGLIGASIGANISLIYASKNKFIPIVVLLSPGWNYTGLETNTAIQQYGQRPLGLAASPGDKYAYDTATQMVLVGRQLKSDTAFFEGVQAQHGTQMLTDEFDSKLLNWIDGNLGDVVKKSRYGLK